MKTVLYFRVSTKGQQASGLGLEAQRAAVEAYCKGRCNVLAEFTEIESGGKDNRPVLAEAIHYAKVTNAKLIVAKLDRLTRDLHFVTSLQKSGVKFVAADNPDANDLTIHILVAMAQHEREAISRRTREALQAARARGVKLGNPNGAEALRRAKKGNEAAVKALISGADDKAADLAPIIVHIREAGHSSLRQIADELNRRGIETPRGKQWQANSVRQLLRRLEKNGGDRRLPR